MVPRCYLDLRFARVETETAVISGRKSYVIVIANGDVFENIHFEDQSVFNKWLQELTRYCIFGQIEKYFVGVRGGNFGEGAYGEVFLAKNIKDEDDLVVVKTYKKEHTQIQKGQKKPKKNNAGEMILDEIKILRKLEHPNILKLRMVFEEPGVKTLVTDYYEGGDLFKHLCSNNHILSWREALEYTKGVLTGLAYLEKFGIVHRDIKLGNVARRYNDNSHNVVILDFGFAVRIKDCKTIPKKYGTVGFYAPEVLSGQEMFDCRADVYSTGILLFTM